MKPSSPLGRRHRRRLCLGSDRMPIELIPFQASHLDELAEQPATAYLRPYIDRSQLAALEGTLAFTGFWNGRLVGCAGIFEHWQGRGEAWAFLARDCKPAFPAIHRAAQRLLEVCPFRRVEAAVACDFPAAIRWVRLLGFRRETIRLKGYGPEGRDYVIYARLFENSQIVPAFVSTHRKVGWDKCGMAPQVPIFRPGTR